MPTASGIARIRCLKVLYDMTSNVLGSLPKTKADTGRFSTIDIYPTHSPGTTTKLSPESGSSK